MAQSTKSKKILWLDLETTGLSAYRNDVVQIAALVEIDGKVVQEFEAKLAPMTDGVITPEALKIHGYTEEILWAFPPARNGIKAFVSTLSQYVDRYDKNDKFVVAGYYVAFDMDFLRQTFRKVGEQYFGSYFYSALLDVQAVTAIAILEGLRLADYKLATVCASQGIKIDAHNAMSDIKATREWAYKAGLFE